MAGSQDLLKLREELLGAYSRNEMTDLGHQFSFSLAKEIAEGALRRQVGDMVEELSSKGRLGEMLEIVRKERSNKPELVAIISHLQEATNLTFTLRQKLREVLAPGSVSEGKVREFYSASRPMAVVLRNEFDEAFEAAIGLAAVSPNVGSTPREKYPVLSFVERIAFFWEDTDVQGAKALMEWSMLAADHFGISGGDADEIRRHAREVPTVSRHLLIQFHPTGDKYRLEAHLWAKDVATPRPIDCDPRDERPLTANELPAAVGPIIKKALDIDVGCIVEFLAPMELLNQPFDSWKVMLRKFSSRLGVLTPVVIRLYDRVLGEDPQEIQYWKKKWMQSKNVVKPGFFWIDNASIDPDSVYEAMILPGGPPCVALGFAPASMELPLVVQAALSAGAPVLLWIRDATANTAAIRKEIEDVLKAMNGLPSLPGLIRAYRTKNPPTAHPNDFTLFYDCPDRLPPPPRQLGIVTSNQGDAT